jgi:hypothetical protein
MVSSGVEGSREKRAKLWVITARARQSYLALFGAPCRLPSRPFSRPGRFPRLRRAATWLWPVSLQPLFDGAFRPAERLAGLSSSGEPGVNSLNMPRSNSASNSANALKAPWNTSASRKSKVWLERLERKMGETKRRKALEGRLYRGMTRRPWSPPCCEMRTGF